MYCGIKLTVCCLVQLNLLCKRKKKYHGLKLCESDINNSDVNVCRYLIIAEAEQEVRKRPRQFVVFHSVLSQS